MVSLKYIFLLDKRLSSLSPAFKFYKVVLNNCPYILGIHYLANNSVRKVRLSLSGLYLEDIVDTILPSGRLKRVDGNSVIILEKKKQSS